MPGPCSLPNGDKSEWDKLNEGICNIHKYCWPSRPTKDKDGNERSHEFISSRLWLMQRNKLRTGKTV